MEAQSHRMHVGPAASRRAGRSPLGVGIALALAACGPLGTEAPDSGDVFDGPLDGLGPGELAAFVRGDEEFGRAFTVETGLGPIFNNVSCGSCHSGDGRGVLANRLTRISLNGDLLLHLGGPQIQDKAIPGAEPERVPAGAEVSVRLPPPVFGVGLVEAIPPDAILAYVDSLDADGDGISGRPNWVTPPGFVPADEPGGGLAPQLGRFSRKAQVSSLVQQVVEAYRQDIGITSDFDPVENVNPLASRATLAADRVPDPELPASTVMAVVNYIRMLAPPALGEPTPRRERGQVVFQALGCAGCHVPSYVTGPSPIPALAGRTIHPYSDFLLHDLGDELADHRPDGSATGREFRTAPLWGLRLMRDFLAGKALLLHDGRATSVDEAVRLHGGEAQRARDAYVALPADDRDALLDFVESL